MIVQTYGLGLHIYRSLMYIHTPTHIKVSFECVYIHVQVYILVSYVI